MNRLAAIAALLMASSACQSKPSKLDGLEGSASSNVNIPPPTGDINSRVERLEKIYAKNAEALDFLGKVYAQQKAQQDQQENSEPAPDAVFAVDIAPDVKAGQVEGSSSALVTIVEAWDFA